MIKSSNNRSEDILNFYRDQTKTRQQVTWEDHYKCRSFLEGDLFSGFILACYALPIISPHAANKDLTIFFLSEKKNPDFFEMTIL